MISIHHPTSDTRQCLALRESLCATGQLAFPQAHVSTSYHETAFDHFNSTSHFVIRVTPYQFISFGPVWALALRYRLSDTHTGEEIKFIVMRFPYPVRFLFLTFVSHTFYVDIVGPLPFSSGYTHILARKNLLAPFRIIHQRISRRHMILVFAVSTITTTDLSSQFQCVLFHESNKPLGYSDIMTTIWHKSSGGMTNQSHCQLKTILVLQHNLDSWSGSLPLVPLGIRFSVNDCHQCSAAEIVFGANICLLGEYFHLSPPIVRNVPQFVSQLRGRMRRSHRPPTCLSPTNIFAHNNLHTKLFMSICNGTQPQKIRITIHQP